MSDDHSPEEIPQRPPHLPHQGQPQVSSDWVADDALANLSMERQIHPEESVEDTARRLFRENSSVAALSIIHLSRHASTERIRLDASKYVLDRVLGRVGDDAYGQTKDPLEMFIKGVEEYANAQSNQ